jgi:hypothetical protein
VPRADTGNFNRFLTSIGLLLIAGALLIPYFYFRDSETLQITKAELRDLTPTAQEALERRQRRSADLEVPVLALSILLVGGGISALFFGGKRLRIAQGKEDDAIERQARREDYEFQQLSVDEVEIKRDEQAREAVWEDKAAEPEPETKKVEGPAPTMPTTRQPQPSAVAGGSPPRNLADVRYRQMREDIARIEEKTKQVLEQIQLDRFEYFSELQIVQAGGRRRVRVDGLFRAKVASQPDITLELTVTRIPQSRARLDADRLLAHLVRYREMTGREALGWLLIVVPEGEDSGDERDWSELEEKYTDLLAGLGRCSTVREQDLDELPDRFTAIFGS